MPIAPAGRVSAGRMCYLALLLVAAVVSYQHHLAMQHEIEINRRSRDQFEKLYDEVLNQESEWKSKYDKARQKGAQLQEVIDGLKEQVQAAADGRKTIQASHDELKHHMIEMNLGLEDEKILRTQLEREKRTCEEELSSKVGQLELYERERNGLESTLKALRGQVQVLQDGNEALSQSTDTEKVQAGRVTVDPSSLRSRKPQKDALDGDVTHQTTEERDLDAAGHDSLPEIEEEGSQVDIDTSRQSGD